PVAPDLGEAALLQQNRRLGEALAREVAERERTRLSWWSGAEDFTPVGMRLLSLFPTTRGRVLAGAVAVGAVLGGAVTAFVARKHPMLQGAGFVAGLLTVAPFTPNPRSR